MKPILILALIAAVMPTLRAQNTEPPRSLDGASMQSGDIAKQWQKAPQSAPPLTRSLTRGIKVRGSTLQTEGSSSLSRGVNLSSEGVKANAAALASLRLRGVKILKGAEAVAAQKAQDQSAVSPSVKPASAFVEMPVVPEKQISFRLRFQQDSTELADEQSLQMLANIAEAMRSVPDSHFLLEGHTCDLGDEDYNLRLSERRALKVRDLLVDAGIEARRLLSVGQGEKVKAVANDSEENRALNRRVMIGPIELVKPQ